MLDSGRTARWAVFSTAIAAGAVLSGCAGYRFGAGSLYPPDIHTVYVPVIESESFRRNLGERLTEAVVKQIESSTPYKVVGSPQADSVLSCRIVRDSRDVIVEDSFDQPRESETRAVVQVRWLDRRGDLVGEQLSLDMPGTLVEQSATTLLVPEYGQSVTTSQQQAIERLARKIVAQMETPW